MQGLLKQIGIARDAVEPLAPPAAYGRERLVSEAFRPAAATELWRTRLADEGFAAHAGSALERLAFVEAANAEEEALAIASPCARPSPWQARPPRWSRPTGRSGAACSQHSRAGKSRSTIPAAMRSPTRRPACFARLAAEAALGGLARSACSRCSSIRCSGSAPPQARTRERLPPSNAPSCVAHGRGPEPMASRTRSRRFGRSLRNSGAGALRSAPVGAAREPYG